MPIYEYECRKCGHRFEKIQKVGANRVGTCPECKGKVDRLASAPAIQFKGTGWYVTDYSEKGKKAKAAERAESGEKSSADKKTDGKKTDAKKADTSKGESKKPAKKPAKSGD